MTTLRLVRRSAAWHVHSRQACSVTSTRKSPSSAFVNVHSGLVSRFCIHSPTQACKKAIVSLRLIKRNTSCLGTHTDSRMRLAECWPSTVTRRQRNSALLARPDALQQARSQVFVVLCLTVGSDSAQSHLPGLLRRWRTKQTNGGLSNRRSSPPGDPPDSNIRFDS